MDIDDAGAESSGEDAEQEEKEMDEDSIADVHQPPRGQADQPSGGHDPTMPVGETQSDMQAMEDSADPAPPQPALPRNISFGRGRAGFRGGRPQKQRSRAGYHGRGRQEQVGLLA